MLRNLRLREQSGVLVKILHLCDAAAVVCILYLAILLYQVPWSQAYTNLVLFLLPLSCILFYSFSLYQPWRGKHFYTEFLQILKAWVVIVGLVFFALFLTKTTASYSRVVLLAWSVIVPLAVFGFHLAARYLLRVLRSQGFNQKRAVIVGAGDLGLEFAKYLRCLPWTGIKIQGFFDDNKRKEDFSSRDRNRLLGGIDELKDYLGTQEIDFVYIALPLRAQQRINDVLSMTRTSGVQVFLVPDLFAFQMFSTKVESLGNMPIINFHPEQPMKRYFDILFSSAVLLVCSPLFLVIGLLIKLEDRGPVFYKHSRITRTGNRFGCLKFRTMHVDADKRLQQILDNDPQARQEWEQTYKLKDDPRVTRVGNFLRQTSLDELPQFINVLKGEMSVVGARPVVYDELLTYYNDSAGIYCSVKPGVTGIWQVEKRNDIEDYQERVEMDTYYILNHSLWMDLKIIAKTVVKMLRREGAY